MPDSDVRIDITPDVDTGYVVAVSYSLPAGQTTDISDEDLKSFVRSILFGGLHSPLELPITNFMKLSGDANINVANTNA